MRITVLAGGIGAARFLRGLLALLGDTAEGSAATGTAAADFEVTVIGNTADDMTLYGLRVCPDLDTVMYTLAGVNDEAQGWGLAGETWEALGQIRAYGGVASWFGLGDRDLGTHLARTALLAEGYRLSEVTAMLASRWPLGVRLLPMTDDPVETHVTVEDGPLEAHAQRMHFQEYWVRHHAELPVAGLDVAGVADATPAPGVLEAIESADLLLLPPSNPVVSIGPILAVPGVRDAVVGARAPVVGLSPIIGGAPVRGMADKLLPAIGVETTATGVALHYGNELLDGWLVDSDDSGSVAELGEAGISCRAVPLLMSSVPAAAAMARAALDLGEALGANLGDFGAGGVSGTGRTGHPGETDRRGRHR